MREICRYIYSLILIMRYSASEKHKLWGMNILFVLQQIFRRKINEEIYFTMFFSWYGSKNSDPQRNQVFSRVTWKSQLKNIKKPSLIEKKKMKSWWFNFCSHTIIRSFSGCVHSIWLLCIYENRNIPPISINKQNIY